MKAKLSLDQFADVSMCTDTQRDLLKFKPGRDRFGKPAPVAFFAAGTIFEGEQALALCRTGQAVPADEECAQAIGMSSHQIEALQLEYRMTDLGINDKDDRELYRAGVIAGYRRLPGDKIEYIHGPKWDEYQAAIEAAAELDDDIDDGSGEDEEDSE